MYLVFYSTSDVFRAEELLTEKNLECSIVPTPVTDKAYCGVCVKLADDTDVSALENLEYERVEG
jgi:hypothetical protein